VIGLVILWQSGIDIRNVQTKMKSGDARV
jgi:hypothetical protein